MQAWEYNKVIGKINVTWDSDGNVVSCLGETYLPYDSDTFGVVDSHSQPGKHPSLSLFICDLKHSTSYSSSSPFPLEIIDNSGDIEKIARFLAVQPSLIATEEDASMLEIIESYTAETDAQRKKVVASAGQNICNNRGQGPGTIDSGCEDRPIQTLLGGGTCLLVSQGD